MDRRKFFRNSAYSVAGMIIGNNTAREFTKDRSAPSSFDIMKEVKKYRKIDAHEHVGLGATFDVQRYFREKFKQYGGPAGKIRKG